MGYIAKLRLGSRTLDLSADPYRLAPDFAPPATAQQPQFGYGTSANRMGGGQFIGRRAVNRDWSFGLRLAGDNAIRSAAARLQSFLDLAGDEYEPLYLEYRDNNAIAAEPLWGTYGAALRYEIVQGRVEFGALYGAAGLRAEVVPDCRVTLTIKPFATNKAQLLPMATGGILEDKIGRADGLPIGTVIPPATTNYFLNPAFTNTTDWKAGWSVGTDVNVSENTVSDYVLPGLGLWNSAKITFSGSGTSRTFTQSITMPTASTPIILSAYVRLPNGDPVTVQHAAMLYSTAATTSTTCYLPIANGWYRLSASAAASAAAKACGLVFASTACNLTLYTTGFQIQESASLTQFVYGDMLGAQWNNTSACGSSTRGNAFCRLAVSDSTFNPAEFTVRAVARFDISSGNIPSGEASVIWAATSATCSVAPLLQYEVSTSKFRFAHEGQEIKSAVLTFNAGCILTLHVTAAGSAGAALYVNGSAVASGVYKSPSAVGDYLYIGSKHLPEYYVPGALLDFATYDRAAAASEIANDYAAIAPIIAASQRVGAVPWLWSQNGDGTATDANGYLNTARVTNYLVAGGVPGTANAKISASFGSTAGTQFILSRWDIPEFFSPSGMLTFIQTGSTGTTTDAAAASTSASGTFFGTTSNASTVIATGGWAGKPPKRFGQLAGRQVHAFFRVFDVISSKTSSTASATYSLNIQYSTGINVTPDTYSSAERRVDIEAGCVLWETGYTNALAIPTRADMMIDYASIGSASVRLVHTRINAAGACTIRTNFFNLLPGPMVVISGSPTFSAAGPTGFMQDDTYVLTTNAGNILAVRKIAGNTITLKPGYANVIFFAYSGNYLLSPGDIVSASIIGMKAIPCYSLV